jgi:diguanylate cyclase (GGDEF)-like protein
MPSFWNTASVRRSEPGPPPSAAEIAEAAGATDLFVFRRVAERRFAHVGGVGRGAGWAGILEVSADEELLVQAACAPASVLRRSASEPWHVFGPYYGRCVAVVAVSPDVSVVFGATGDTIASVSDDDLGRLARLASEALVDVAPAKRLADELEALNAVRDLLHAPADTYDEALQRLVDQATTSLSCDLGLLYICDESRVVVSDQRPEPRLDRARAVGAVSALARRETFPVCVQRAEVDELLPPFSSADGVLAYYLLEIKTPLPGVLLLLHTEAAAPRGFTLLCQSLGARLVEAAEPLLAAALHRDAMRAELEQAAVQARRDPLTGLANRLAWEEALSKASASVESPASIVLVDCRNLKLINDTEGHHVGDRVLCRVAAALAAGVRTDDLVARLGGDEFAILLCGADEEIAARVVERIEAALDREGGVGQPKISLAVGTATSRDDDLRAAQQRADREMLAAKRAFREETAHASSA